MTQNEFEERVRMTVSAEEYWAINEVYNNSDLDMEAFCKAWMRMNESRVKKARLEAKEKAHDSKQREQLWAIVMKYGGMSYDVTEHAASTMLTQKQRDLVRSVGIELEHFGHAKSLSYIIYDIKKYLKAA